MATLLLPLVAIFVIVEGVSLAFGGLVDRVLIFLPGIDKVLHAAAFLAICVAADQLTKRALPSLRDRAIVLGLALLALAAVDELAQGVRPDRDLDLWDFVASVSGLVMGIAWVARTQLPRIAGFCALTALAVAGSVTVDSYRTQRHMNAAVRFERAGDFSSARGEYRRAYESGIRSANLLNELGWVEIESGEGDPRLAVEYAAQALAMRPDDPDIHDTYGWALHHAGRSAEALPYLERAYSAKPDMFCIHYHLGEVYLAVGQEERAASHFLEQLKRPDTREASRARVALARMGRAG
ncbi:MAG: tetratricopeptide repeat protein [Acidobacteria bacterium]|nr:tetratricopeptide repeat protein [Acidobacteriota bacterium]